ncbi:MAG: hypothetical protein JNL47_07035 [Bacteroidia bacterium]|nr:hypothetical protein [Bacteroidia bacterium]
MENPSKGLCNIGEQEIRLRKKLLTITTAFGLLASYLFIFHHDSIWLLVIFFLTLFASILIYWEVRTRFCVLFGIFNLQNFGTLGKLNEVTCPDTSRKARNKAVKMIVNSMFIAALITGVLFYSICLNSH